MALNTPIVAARRSTELDSLFLRVQEDVQALAQLASTDYPYRVLTKLEDLCKNFELLTNLRECSAAISSLYDKLPEMLAVTLDCEYSWERAPEFEPCRRYTLGVTDIQYTEALPAELNVASLAEQLTLFFKDDEYICPPNLESLFQPLEPLYNGVLGEGKHQLFDALDGRRFIGEMEFLQVKTTRAMIDGCDGDIDFLARALFPQSWNSVAPALGLPLSMVDEESMYSMRPRG